MLLDMHAHVIPGELAPQTGPGGNATGPRVEPGETEASRTLVTDQMRFSASDLFFSAERRLEMMEASGVDAEAVSPMPPLLDFTLPVAAGRDLSKRVNDFVAAMCETAPTRFYGLGMVPMQDPEAAAGELAAVKALGLKGIEIGSNANGRSLADPSYLPFFEEAERLGLAIFIHALTPTVRDAIPPAGMPSFGFATEIGIAAAALVTSALPEKCPRLRLAFSHGAGGFSLALTRAHWFWGRTWNEEAPDPSAGPVPEGPSPSELARRFYYDTLVFDRRALRYLIDMLGPSQLLIGTDFPAMAREQPAGRTLSSMGLPPEILADITWNNCVRFLGLEASVADGEAPRARSGGKAAS